MENQKFCVYNQASESFLSLGITVADTTLEHVRELLAGPSLRFNEGLWVVPSKGQQTVSVGMTCPIDMLYLDSDYRVIHTVESSSRFRAEPVKMAAASLLILPAHAIYSSQTQDGNQLVICPADALQFRLKNTAMRERSNGMNLVRADRGSLDRTTDSQRARLYDDRRRAPRQLNPRLVANDKNGDKVTVHGIRDASTSGLYLLTEKRWPLGTLLVMTLQRPDTMDEDCGPSIAVQLEVIRCGADGVGLQFVPPGSRRSTQWFDAGRSIYQGQERRSLQR